MERRGPPGKPGDRQFPAGAVDAPHRPLAKKGDQDKYNRLSLRLLARVERALDELARKRTGGRRRFDQVGRRIARSVRESERKEAREEAIDRILEGRA